MFDGSKELLMRFGQIVFLCFPFQLFADEAHLECASDQTSFALSIIIDTEAGIVRRSQFANIPSLGWKIKEITPNFLTATDSIDKRSPDHGGEILTIQRHTGHFTYVNIGLHCQEHDCDPNVVNVLTETGTCRKQLF
ncbi:hypothetical protein [Celeribacter sp.]|uniref:hypothetical protein n=1 Tax=Celeribacter sp. TaxID=1890673 RepID=UPI003A91E4E9